MQRLRGAFARVKGLLTKSKKSATRAPASEAPARPANGAPPRTKEDVAQAAPAAAPNQQSPTGPPARRFRWTPTLDHAIFLIAGIIVGGGAATGVAVKRLASEQTALLKAQAAASSRASELDLPRKTLATTEDELTKTRAARNGADSASEGANGTDARAPKGCTLSGNKEQMAERLRGCIDAFNRQEEN